MALAFLAAILFSFIPALIYSYILYWLDRYEKEPKHLILGAFLWGMVVAAGGAFILNTFFGIGVWAVTGDEAITNLLTGSISAPLFEESFKGLAVLLVFLIFRSEFDSVLDGIMYAGITALGFAATENTLYLFDQGYVESGWEGFFTLFFLRVVLGAWNHAFYTAFIGIGFALARLNRSWVVRILAPLLGLCVAMFAHFLHNTLASFTQSDCGFILAMFGTDWFGWLFILGIIVWAIVSERNWIKKNLAEEVENGLISPAHYRIAYSPWTVSVLRLKALFSGKYTATREFYHLLVELAYKKHHRSRLGEESGNSLKIEQLRDEISKLAPQALGG